MISLLYRVKPSEDMTMSSRSMMIPKRVMRGSVPPKIIPCSTNINPPNPKLYPVPTKMSMRLLNPRVIKLALAEQSALRIIIPSPQNEIFSVFKPPIFRMRIPINPMVQPMILRASNFSLGKKTHANSTSTNTLIEFRIAARAPAL